MYDRVMAAGRYMADGWDRGTKIAVVALGATIIAQFIGPYFTRDATQDVQIGMVLKGQDTAAGRFDKLDEDRREARRLNDIRHQATETRVTIAEQTLIMIRDRFGEFALSLKELNNKIDQVIRSQRAESRERYSNPFASAKPDE